jgi:exodeoxyribonuclease VII small subunit
MTDETAHDEKPRRAARARQRGEMPEMTANEPATPPAFEEALARLDEIVALLEGGQLPLDQSLTFFEEGVHLYQQCQRMLDSADLRLQRLRFSPAPSSPASDASDAEDDLFFVETFEMDER